MRRKSWQTYSSRRELIAVQSRYQAECIIRRWEDSQLTPPECYEPVDDDEMWLRADDEAEEQYCERRLNNA